MGKDSVEWGNSLPSRSLKLLPMLGVPSLSREYPLPLLGPGLRPVSSIVRRGDSGPLGLCLSPPCGCAMCATELAEESEAWERWARWWDLWSLRDTFWGLPRRVALRSWWPLAEPSVWAR